MSALFAAPACIIPLGPDFQDPPGAENIPPYIISSSPQAGSIVSTQRFEVTVTDANPGDDLHIRWYADFPPSTSITRPLVDVRSTILHSADGTVQTTPLEADVDCASDNLVPGLDRHIITVLIADRDFVGGSDVSAIAPGGDLVTATWSLLLQCPSGASP